MKIVTRMTARFSLFLFPTEWALHVAGDCYCQGRGSCKESQFWPASRPDLSTHRWL